MREINEIIIHCTATNPRWLVNENVSDVVKEIRRWHTDPKPHGRGWSDIGYHFVIHRNGQVGRGRPVERIGAHTRGKNRNSIGIALVGGRGGCADDSFFDNFTEEQLSSLKELIAYQKDKYGELKVSGHNEYANKACPCFNVHNWF